MIKSTIFGLLDHNLQIQHKVMIGGLLMLGCTFRLGLSDFRSGLSQLAEQRAKVRYER